ncbi:hypothetical protein EG328_003364 [Venturia inaequalis]|uniref:C2H2-type domain-containing protein n=1 Tax=Venturia inaequalis TaxID=5025 RepID=A0A8H3VGD0_VENIN|nr:hypothetical protein EG328_003364 [Venturia inaequalis]
MDDHGNSSDAIQAEEDDIPAQPKPWEKITANAQAMMAQMTTEKKTIRLATKRAFKVLADINPKQSPQQQSRHFRMVEMFWHFYSVILGKKYDSPHAFTTLLLTVLSKTTPPTAQDLCRFVSYLPNLCAPANGGVSVLYLLDWYRIVMKDIRFKFDVQYSEREGKQVSASLNTLIIEGKVYLAQSKNNQVSLSATVIARLIRAILNDAIHNGTASWDAVIGSIFPLALMASLAASSGDVGTSSSWAKKNRCLRLKHIDLRYIQSGGTGYFIAEILMAESNSMRFRPAIQQQRKRVAQIQDHNFAFACPINMLVAIALRFQHVDAVSYEDLIAKAKMVPGGCIKWIHPERPVVMSLGNHIQLDPIIQCGPRMINQILRRASTIAGLYDTNFPTSLDVKRGATRDIAFLSKKSKDHYINVEGAGRAAGHESTASTMTQQYIGADLAGDSWTLRLNNPLKDDFDPIFMDTPEAKPAPQQRRFSTKEIDAKLEELGLDSTIATRLQASATLRADRQKGSMETYAIQFAEAINQTPGTVPLTGTPKGLKVTKSRTSPKDIDKKIKEPGLKNTHAIRAKASAAIQKEKPKTSMDTDTAATAEQSPDTTASHSIRQNHSAAASSSMSTGVGSLSDAHQVNDQEVEPASDTLIDPILLNLEARLVSDISVPGLDAGLELLVENTVALSLPELNDPFLLPADQLIPLWSRINTFSKSSGGGKSPNSGGTRDDPTRMKLKCRNSIRGCRFQNLRRDRVVNHEKDCKISEYIQTQPSSVPGPLSEQIQTQTHPRLQEKLTCPFELCDRIYESQKALNKHYWVHVIPGASCTLSHSNKTTSGRAKSQRISDPIFHSKDGFIAHIRNEHAIDDRSKPTDPVKIKEFNDTFADWADRSGYAAEAARRSAVGGVKVGGVKVGNGCETED